MVLQVVTGLSCDGYHIRFCVSKILLRVLCCELNSLLSAFLRIHLSVLINVLYEDIYLTGTVTFMTYNNSIE